MSNKIPTVIDLFDNLFDDKFVEKATDEEIESCFIRMKEICAQESLNMNEVIEELEFYCNSFIAHVSRRDCKATSSYSNAS